MVLQKTVAKPVDAIGIGVHTGKRCHITLRPASANTGIRFRRTDQGGGTVAAKPECVYDTTLCTSLAFNNIQVGTVEHLMSALWALEIDNLLVDLDSDEVPIFDGSAIRFVDLIQAVGVVDCNAPRKYLRIKEGMTVTQGDSSASLLPFEGFKASYTFASPHPAYSAYPKFVEIDFNVESYVECVGRARSFGLLEELAQAQAINRCLGSDLTNAVGIDDDGILNKDGLRYEDEFVKHKILDAIGDLYLLGMPILGEFRGYKSGHALNNKLARAVIRCPENWDLVNAFDIPEIGIAD